MWYLPPRIDPEESFNEFMEDAPRLELSDDIEARKEAEDAKRQARIATALSVISILVTLILGLK